MTNQSTMMSVLSRKGWAWCAIHSLVALICLGSLFAIQAKAENDNTTHSWLAQGESAAVGGAEAADVSLSENTYTIHTAKGLAWIAWNGNGYAGIINL